MRITFGLILVVISFLASRIATGQTRNSDTTPGDEVAKIFNKEVALDVDTILFNTKQNNFYLSAVSKAMLMTMVVPIPFSGAEAHLDKERKKKEYQPLERKKLVHNGKNVLYERGIIKKSGQTAYMYLYAIECTEESTILVTGMHMDGDEKKIFPAIERAALSAKLVGKKK